MTDKLADDAVSALSIFIAAARETGELWPDDEQVLQKALTILRTF